MIWLAVISAVLITSSSIYLVTEIQEGFDNAFSGDDEAIEKPQGYDFFSFPQKMTFYLNSVSLKAWAGIATSVFLIVTYSKRRY